MHEDVPDPPVPGFSPSRFDLIAQELAVWILNPLVFLVHGIAEPSRPLGIEDLGLVELVHYRDLNSILAIVIIVTVWRPDLLHRVTEEMVQVDVFNCRCVRRSDQTLGSRDQQAVRSLDLQQVWSRSILD